VDRTRAKDLDRRQMFGGRVAFVLGKPIPGIGLVQLNHQTVPADFGKDARRADGVTGGVARHYRGLRELHGFDSQAIDDHVFRRGTELGEGEVHGAVAGAQYVNLVDHLAIDLRDGVTNFRTGNQFVEEFFAPLGSELFGVVHLAKRSRKGAENPFDGKNHGSGEHRPRQGTASRLVNTRDSGDPLFDQGQLVPESAQFGGFTCPAEVL
jgi:hypothetical protein